MGTHRETRAPMPESAAAPPVWPGEPEDIAAGTVDFEAVALVLANTCRWGGRTPRFYSLAQRALTMAEAVEAMDGVPEADRRSLALHALLACAPAAWLGDAEGAGPASAKAAERARRHGERIDRAVREAAGLAAEPPKSWNELLRLVAHMTDAAERRDVGGGPAHGAGVPFPPLKLRIRPMRPERAARRWLDRFRALTGASGGGTDPEAEALAAVAP